MKQEIFFKSGDEQCAALYYLPHSTKKLPVIVMAHGLSGVKEMGIEYYAESFYKEGFAVLLFDYRYLGQSSGEPRYQCSPSIMQDDYNRAIDFVTKDRRIDPERIGLWGTSFSGGQVIEIAYRNKNRIKCFYAQVPALSSRRLFREYSLMNRVLLKSVIKCSKLIELVTKKQIYIPLAAPKRKLSALGEDSLVWLSKQEKVTNFKNTIDIKSLAEIIKSDPVEKLKKLKELPKMFLLGTNDTLVSYQKSNIWLIEAGVNKNEINSFNGGHYDVYDNIEIQNKSMLLALSLFNSKL